MHRNIIAIGGSAGSLDTLLSIVAAFSDDFKGNILAALHIGNHSSQLPELLARAGKLPVDAPPNREPIRPGHIYVAPADRHLIVEPGVVRVSRGPREHFTRPAIDPLFRSVAATYDGRVIGVVLSGGGSDGAFGLDTIKRAGGLAVVLDPRDAIAPDMPQAAAEIVEPDYLVRAVELPGLLARLSEEEISEFGTLSAETLAGAAPEVGASAGADLPGLRWRVAQDRRRVNSPVPLPYRPYLWRWRVGAGSGRIARKST